MSCFRCWQYTIAVFLLFSAGLYITSGAVTYWWVINSGTVHQVMTQDEGLWKSCTTIGTTTTCQRRNSLLKFEESDTYDLNKDIVLVSIAAGAVLTLIPLIFVAITMCRRYPSKMTILIGLVFLFFGMAAGIFGTVWALVKISSSNQGWAFYCLYGADGFAILSFVLCLILLFCIPAPGAYVTTNRDDEIAMLAR